VRRDGERHDPIDESKSARVVNTVEASAKPNRPPIASPNPGSVLAFVPFQEFIEEYRTRRTRC